MENNTDVLQSLISIYNPNLKQFPFSPKLIAMKTILCGALLLAFLSAALAEGIITPLFSKTPRFSNFYQTYQMPPVVLESQRRLSPSELETFSTTRLLLGITNCLVLFHFLIINYQRQVQRQCQLCRQLSDG